MDLGRLEVYSSFLQLLLKLFVKLCKVRNLLWLDLLDLLFLLYFVYFLQQRILVLKRRSIAQPLPANLTILVDDTRLNLISSLQLLSLDFWKKLLRQMQGKRGSLKNKCFFFLAAVPFGFSWLEQLCIWF